MKNAIVTGSNSGIGYATALDLSRKGYKVWAGMRSIEKGAKLKAEADKENLSLELLQLDVNDAASMTSAVKQVLDADGQIDVLVNNAGIASGAPLEFVNESDLRGVMETNFFGAFKLMQLVVPSMRERSTGAIINITSIFGFFANPGQSVYCASKFALEGASHSLAGEVAPFNVRVICVEPGLVLTSIFEKQPKIDPALMAPPFPYHAVVRRTQKLIESGLKNPAYPQDVADVIDEAITSDSPKAQYRVGIDAAALWDFVGNEPREEFVRIAALTEDADYVAEFSRKGLHLE
jgi:NAD(P)-dependent dehydrogenase (short-subunit alcohol dehydrogenase family)